MPFAAAGFNAEETEHGAAETWLKSVVMAEERVENGGKDVVVKMVALVDAVRGRPCPLGADCGIIYSFAPVWGR